MNRLKLWLLGLPLLLAACQSDELATDGIATGGDGNVTFKLTAPEAMAETRAADGRNSALGGLTNADFNNTYDLRYQLAVYRVDGDNNYTQVITPQMQVVDSYQPVNYSLRLTPNRTYKVVVWADFVKQGETDDLHYNTADFTNITCKDAEDAQLNDESRDAYFITQEFKVTDDKEASQDLTLLRPFAKLRVVTTDWNDGENQTALEMPNQVKVKYYGCSRFNNLNAVTGESASEELGDAAAVTAVYTGSINKNEKYYSEGYDKSANNRTIMVDYLMTDKSAQTPIHLTLETLDGNTTIASHDLKTDIPIQRNWLTTIIGNTMTTGAQFAISIDPRFTNEWVVGQEWWEPSGATPVEPKYDEAANTYHISSKEEFMWLPDHINDMLSSHPNFTLSIDQDIDMSGVEWKPIYPNASAKIYTVEGNGHTLRNFSMSGEFGAVYEYTSFLKYNAYTGVWGKFDGTMKNLTFENITINGLANDKVHYDTEGNKIDHSKEYAYFAGCIGYTGGNEWSMDSKFINVHAKHIVIKSSATAQNLGGLIGWIGSGGGTDAQGNRCAQLEDCTAQDIHLTGSQAGGLVGQVLATGSRGVNFKRCLTEDIYIRYTLANSMSGFIGRVGDAGLHIDGTANVDIYDSTPAQHVEYIKNSTGEINTTYKPESEYYGKKNPQDNVNIHSTSTEP